MQYYWVEYTFVTVITTVVVFSHFYYNVLFCVYCSKHARRHPNFDPTVLRQRRAAVKAFSVNSSDGTPSEHSVPSPWVCFTVNTVMFNCGQTVKFVKSPAILVRLLLQHCCEQLETLIPCRSSAPPLHYSVQLTVTYRTVRTPKHSTFFFQVDFMNKPLQSDNSFEKQFSSN